jgi:hypothetical protein
VYAKDGYRTYRRGNTEYVVPPERQYRPRLVRDLSHQVAECRAELGQAQAAVAAAREVVAGKRAAVAQAERELQTAVQAHQVWKRPARSSAAWPCCGERGAWEGAAWLGRSLSAAGSVAKHGGTAAPAARALPTLERPPVEEVER